MKRAPRIPKKTPIKSEPHPEARGVFIIAGSIFVFLSLFSFVDNHHEQNILGLAGHLIAHSLHYLFGLGSYILIAFMTFFGWKFLKNSLSRGIIFKS